MYSLYGLTWNKRKQEAILRSSSHSNKGGMHNISTIPMVIFSTAESQNKWKKRNRQTKIGFFRCCCCCCEQRTTEHILKYKFSCRVPNLFYSSHVNEAFFFCVQQLTSTSFASPVSCPTYPGIYTHAFHNTKYNGKVFRYLFRFLFTFMWACMLLYRNWYIKHKTYVSFEFRTHGTWHMAHSSSWDMIFFGECMDGRATEERKILRS